jgi:hypothetical protein
MEELGFLRGPCRCYKQGQRLKLIQFCTGICEEMTCACEAKKSPLLTIRYQKTSSEDTCRLEKT